ncbi:class I lanthipeptide [Sphingobacterium detergens]|uniref:class I lanthipeptide n=1 Tax=Sphingobacterium detergens TaxID=1145106 RepID=UPI000E719B15
MKKKTMSSKLNLKKVTISSLSNGEMQYLQGGATAGCTTQAPPCNTFSICPVTRLTMNNTCLSACCETLNGC